jgi:general secretion pathway protein B
MSYILDALKRADAERTRGAVPGLHAQQLPAAGHAAQTHGGRLPWWLSLAALVLGAVAAGLWFWRAPATQPDAPATAPLAAAPAIAPNPAPVNAPVATTLALPVPVAQSMPAPPAPVAAAATRAPATQVSAPLVANPAKASVTVSSQASAVAPAAVKTSAPDTPPAVVPLLSELPEATRRLVPALNITGTVYSDTPGQRILLVNNQVLGQGSLVAPDLTLEEIRPASSVFNFRGTRFRVAR